MMKFITGQPGNGKSLRALFEMAAEYERNAAAVKAGKEEPRRFFTNIAGATREENPGAFPWVERLPDHNDWTQLPDGSYVVYDEAHADGNTKELARYGTLFPSTGKPGESDDPRIRAMSTHRHRGFDLVFVTQWPTKIHHQVRSLIGEHTHMTRAMGLGMAGVVKWARVQNDPYDERQREKAEEEIWRFDKSLYDRYTSATLHTVSHKFKIPAKVWSGLSVLVVVLGLLWWGYSWSTSRSEDDKPDKDAPAAEGASLLAPAAASPSDEISMLPGVGEFASLHTAAAPTLAGCVSSDRGCRCFNTEGFQIDMARHECELTLAKPLPFNVYHEFKPPTAAPAATTPPAPGTPEQTTVTYQQGARADVFPRSPGYQPGETYTGSTSTL